MRGVGARDYMYVLCIFFICRIINSSPKILLVVYVTYKQLGIQQSWPWARGRLPLSFRYYIFAVSSFGILEQPLGFPSTVSQWWILDIYSAAAYNGRVL